MKPRLYSIILLFPILSSCYCFHKVTGESSVKNLTTYRSYSICDSCPGKGKVFSLTPYFGFPSTDLQRLQNGNSLDVLTEYNSKTSNIIGVRGEYWMKPGNFFPFRIIGLGLDYSFNKSQLNSSIDNFTTQSITRQYNQRLLGCINVMTLVKRHWIGYTTLQLGVNFQKTTFSQNDFYSVRNSQLFAYRIGYGIQFYPNLPIGITLEAGYGAGAYVRTGLTFWVF